jgi:aryl-alcohol dehydrogenase-like predicted oxidoreductase
MDIERIEAVQTEFNIFKTEAQEKLFPYLKENEIGYMSWGTFDKGVLTGRVTRDRKFDKSDFRQADWAVFPNQEAKMRAMDRINPLLKDAGIDGRKLALAFVLDHPEASTAICGIKSTEQLNTALEALANRADQNIVKKALDIAKEEMKDSTST